MSFRHGTVVWLSIRSKKTDGRSTWNNADLHATSKITFFDDSIRKTWPIFNGKIKVIIFKTEREIVKFGKSRLTHLWKWERFSDLLFEFPIYIINFLISEHYQFTENIHARVLVTAHDGIANNRERDGSSILLQDNMVTFLESLKL